ncbi:MAG: hypothetical protein ACLFR7_11285 [Opitutales bacterium]
MPINLLLSESEWAALSDKLEDPFFQRVHANNERAVDIMIEEGREDFWNLAGDLTRPDLGRGNPWNWRVPKNRLYRFALSWRLTGREDSLAEALRAVDVLLDRSYWRAHERFGLRHADLSTADWWTNATFALEALAPALSEERENGLRQLLTEWALPAYLKGVEEGDWWRYAEFNWGAAVHGGAGLAALAVQDTAPDLAGRALAAARRGLRFVIDNLPAGGGWTEGLMYQTTTLAHLTEFVAALHPLTGDDLGLAANPRLHDSLDSRLRMLGGDQHPLNFSNINERSEEWRLPAAYWWARRCGRPEWAGFEDAFPRLWQDTLGIAYEVETFWWREAHQPTKPWTQAGGLWHGRELDWLSWRRRRTWLGLRSGFNGGNHNNLDLGQVIFGVDEARILRDPGYGIGQTARHSCITLKGRDQTIDASAKIFRAEEFSVADGWLLHVACDLRACYPHTLDRHVRHLLAFSDGALLLIDDLLAARGHRLRATGRLQLASEPETSEDGWRMPLGSGDGEIRIRFPLPAEASLGEAFEHEGQTTHPLTYTSGVDAPAALFAVSLSCEGAISVRREDRRLIVSRGETEATLDLDSGIVHPPIPLIQP